MPANKGVHRRYSYVCIDRVGRSSIIAMKLNQEIRGECIPYNCEDLHRNDGPYLLFGLR
jgi:hypothetical protein